jgi:hypothetical protein
MQGCSQFLVLSDSKVAGLRNLTAQRKVAGQTSLPVANLDKRGCVSARARPRDLDSLSRSLFLFQIEKEELLDLLL